MNLKKKRVCRFCLGETEDKFEIIDDITKEMSHVLLLKTNFDISREPIICENCADTVLKSFYFKSLCIDNEEFVHSFAASRKGVTIKLEDVYEDTRIMGHVVDENVSVCRFCLSQFEGSSLVCIDVLLKQEIFRKMLPTHMPEVDLNFTDDPAVCTICRKNLECYFKFVQNCWDTEEKIIKYCQHKDTENEGKVNLSSVQHFLTGKIWNDLGKCALKQEPEVLENVPFYPNNDLLKHEELHIKEETLSLEVEKYKCAIYQYKKHDGCFKNHVLNHNNTSKVGMYKCALCSYQTNHKGSLVNHMLVHKDTSEVKMYKCGVCSFQTKRKGALNTHMLIHKDTSEIKMYKCALCSYQARQKVHLNTHMQMHKNTSEVKMYKCEVCSHQTRHKGNLKIHMLVHKDPSEIKLYKCALCSFQAKQKENLKKHMLFHKNTSEINMYKCTLCTFETKYKSSHWNHMLTHKDTSAVKMYKCEVCSYQTKRSGAVKAHMLIHKDTSEIKMHKCALCSYQARRKENLKNHMVIHKDTSEVKRYKCILCTFNTKHKNLYKNHMLNHSDTKYLPSKA